MFSLLVGIKVLFSTGKPSKGYYHVQNINFALDKSIIVPPVYKSVERCNYR